MHWRAELSQQSDRELLARLRRLPRGDEERAAVCEIIVERYAGLVRSCARQYQGSPEPLEDLTQVGYVGLLKAINNFDPAIGENLASYAVPCISGEIKRHFRDKRWQMHVRRQVQELLLAMRPAAEELTQQLGREPRDEELAERLSVSHEDIREARQASMVFGAFSLDAALSSQEDAGTLLDLLGEDDQGLDHAVDMEALFTHLDGLAEREQRILMLRFYGNLSQTEIADRLGISQMHVSRLLARALSYLRSRLLEDANDSA